jgi:putative transposase
MSRSRKRHVQLTLDQARKPIGWGGWRPNSGRPKLAGSISHKTRPRFAQYFPQHVRLRIKDGEDSIAKAHLMKRAIRPAIRTSVKPWFQVVEFNVLSNHVHLICEADNAMALARGVQGLAIRIARRLNRAVNRKGALFAHRYQAKAVTTPTAVRNLVRYVLQNRKHHYAEKKFSRGWVDAFSSAPWFGGWTGKIYPSGYGQAIVRNELRPTYDAKTWLLAKGWRERGGGPINIDGRPAPS